MKKYMPKFVAEFPISTKAIPALKGKPLAGRKTSHLYVCPACCAVQLSIDDIPEGPGACPNCSAVVNWAWKRGVDLFYSGTRVILPNQDCVGDNE